MKHTFAAIKFWGMYTYVCNMSCDMNWQTLSDNLFVGLVCDDLYYRCSTTWACQTLLVVQSYVCLYALLYLASWSLWLHSEHHIMFVWHWVGAHLQWDVYLFWQRQRSVAFVLACMHSQPEAQTPVPWRSCCLCRCLSWCWHTHGSWPSRSARSTSASVNTATMWRLRSSLVAWLSRRMRRCWKRTALISWWELQAGSWRWLAPRSCPWNTSSILSWMSATRCWQLLVSSLSSN